MSTQSRSRYAARWGTVHVLQMLTWPAEPGRMASYQAECSCGWTGAGQLSEKTARARWKRHRAMCS